MKGPGILEASRYMAPLIYTTIRLFLEGCMSRLWGNKSSPHGAKGIFQKLL